MNGIAPAPARRRFALSVYLSLLFSLVVFAAGAAVAWVDYLQAREFALKSADEVFLQIGQSTRASLAEIMQPARSFAELLAMQPPRPIAGAGNLKTRLEALPFLTQAFADTSALESVYCGYDDGSFFLLRLLDSAEERSLYQAPPAAAYMVESVETADRGKAKTLFLFFDDRLREVERRSPPDFSYDPRSRPWYQMAQVPGRRVLTEPYLFAASGEPGITIAVRTQGASVIGIDASLRGMSERLASLARLPGMKIALFDTHRQLLAQTGAQVPPARRTAEGLSLATLDDAGDPVLAQLKPGDADLEAARTIAAEGRVWNTVVLRLATLRGPMYLGIAVPLRELLGQAISMRDRGLLATAGVLLLALPLTWLTARRVALSLRDITRDAADICAFKFDGPPLSPSVVLEVDQLAEAMAMMRGTIRHFLEIATSLAAETNFKRLLHRVVQETASASGADGGLIYLSEDDGRRLVPAAFVRADGESQDLAPAQPQAIEDDGPLARAIRTRRTVTQRGSAAGLHFLQDHAAEGRLGLVVIPLIDRSGETVGALVLYSTDPEASAGARLAFAEALSKTAAIAIETQRLLEARKALLDAFIQLVAGAIDAKSPYTGGHCQRVPELTMMLARAACEAQAGPFRDFSLSEGDWEALQIASWLHDCGKVTTPEYVVDKATKLETLHDRIHEVRMRFEVLKRDAELEYWKAVAEGGERETLWEALKQTLTLLDEEFAFVAECNEGGEAMDPARLERLREIGARTWLRTLDDRLGISHEERQRKARTPPETLPVRECLLDDKPEHQIVRGEGDRMPADNPWGFRMAVPELKYNRGELYNLSIGRGTLTEEERYVINHHIVQTLIMLSQLPFPRHLAAVPDLAGGHHEKMDGTGYPRQLRREDMSVGARIMAIADIFEALTAVDRPYKRGKTLSESIRIMSAMAREQHIDADLFRLFLASGVYRQYAERFLRPEQIDAVEIEQYLSET
jgi:HD-GYP domain-containing protein (c-di-GMP phosphodiesterase class II)